MDSNWLKLSCLFILYFIQAMPYGFQSRYLPLVMRQSGLSLTSLGLYKLLLLPWVCKFFISAFIIDTYKTKNFWLMKSMQLLVIGSFLGAVFSQPDQIPLILFVLNWASACQDICVDWFAINILKEEDLGLGNTIQVAAFKLGTLFSGGVLVYFIDYTTVSINFTILGVIYLLCYVLLKITGPTMTEKEVEGDEEEGAHWTVKERLSVLCKSPATYWMCSFVLIYKLGEQSALNMLPMFLLDQGVASADIGLWTGILGQTASIIGSVFAGFLLKRHTNTIPTHVWISHIVWIRMLPVALITCLIAAYENSGAQNLDKTTLNCLIAASLAQLLLSGFLTTLTFTLMMQVSFLAARSVQATHFSLLATCEVLGKLLFQPVVSVYTDRLGYSAGFVLFTSLYVVSFLSFQFCPVKYLSKKQN